MKKQIIIGGILIFAVTLFAPRIAQAQGTMTYLSSLSQTPTGTLPVGNDHWLAAMFGTGNNTGGYSLNSVQLGMADASGSPSNFTVMIYSAVVGGGISPGANLDTLDVSLSPTSAGIYTFSAISNLLLVPSTIYFVVVTGGTTIADGAYSWNESSYPPAVSIWGAGNGVLGSGDGASGWSPTPYLGIAQFAINATAFSVPEPGVFGLLGLGGLAFLWHRRRSADA